MNTTMMTNNKTSYLIFKKSVTGKNTHCIYSAKTGDYLGKVYYYIGWHKVIFAPEESTIFDLDCLKEITEFIEGLKVKRNGDSIKDE